VIAGVPAGLAIDIARDREDAPAPHRAVQASPELKRLMAVFRRPPRAADRLPARVVEEFSAIGDLQPGENLRGTRRIDLGAGGAAFVWPKADGVCYGTLGPSGCFPTSLLERLGAVLSSRSRYTLTGRPEQLSVFAVVADGVRTVRFTLDDRSEVAVRVRGNALWSDFDRRPVKARWKDRSGRRHTMADPVPPPHSHRGEPYSTAPSS
jgi:hypothetical protein